VRAQNYTACAIVLSKEKWDIIYQMKLIGTAEAAKRLGVTQDRVRALIRAERLPAQKLGRDYIISSEDLALVKNRKPGRPRKTAR